MPTFALALQSYDFIDTHAEVILFIESEENRLESVRVVKRQVGKWVWFDVDAWHQRTRQWGTVEAVADLGRALEIARSRSWMEPYQ
ncbi:MAG TPA: hypothetical protein VJU59_23150 [Paraburkholderia sp.]|uniref:hypothetical protein n=1 Tax=Paraburkholderia sp. TaxID=1926495 RepID=UPI002B4AA685|nr:hypothetical protein [Paraburkholderia sp.]HKR42531.1 hypothetical protein [Paraburkholderia sp.]